MKEIIEIGNFILYEYDKDSLWLKHTSGEGMQVWNNDFAELLEDYFEENF